MKKQNIIFTATLFALGAFVLSPATRAVNPPPDGGYPGGNTAEGQNALFGLTTGTYNTAVGFLSLRNNTEGQFNTAIGAGALFSNNNTGFQHAPDGVAVSSQNTATGAGALLSNTSGHQNTADGAFALFSNMGGDDGAGSMNTAIGSSALFSNTTGCCNAANGAFALFRNTNAAENCAFGNYALSSNTEANDNSAFGFEALMSSTGAGNTAVGAYSLVSNTTGVLNTAIGLQALAAHATGDNNTALGWLAGNNVTTANNVICIGALVGGANVDNGCYIGNIWNQPGGSQAVYVNSDGKLGALVSSQRFKDDIKPMEHASEALFSLKPVSFRYKKNIDPKGARQLGLVAEDVAKVNRDLVVRDKNGKPYSVRYDQVNAMLLNEFLKEHGKVQELEKGMAALTAQLKEQATQIQKVSAQLGMDKSMKTVVLNNP